MTSIQTVRNNHPTRQANNTMPHSPTVNSTLPSGVSNNTTTNNSETITVVARVRPILPREADEEQVLFVDDEGSQLSVYANGSETPSLYRFDRVFNADAPQNEVFTRTALPLVNACCQGYNAAVFAYGQTGTGKTHTMLGVDLWDIALRSSNISTNVDDKTTPRPPALSSSEGRGLIPRSMERIFEYCNKLVDKQKQTIVARDSSEAPPLIKVSYLEIYNEKVFDLLNYEQSKGVKSGLEIREDKLNGVFVPNAVQVQVGSLSEVMQVLWKGAVNRAMCATDMNEHSSRSHTIFQVTLEQTITKATAERPSSAGGASGRRGLQFRSTTVKRSKLSLVDLAGSEKWRSHQLTCFTDQRIQEMTSINQSLSNLGNVMRGLLTPGRCHVPYRNSKLTRLLQDSLGGNTKTSFVVTLSPSAVSLEENLSTLQFADRAKRVVVAPTMNERPDNSSIIRRLESEVTRLRRMVNHREGEGGNSKQGRRRGGAPSGGVNNNNQPAKTNEEDQRKTTLERDLEREKEKTKMLSRALHRHASSGPLASKFMSSKGGSGISDVGVGANEYASIEELDNAALKLAPRLSAFRATIAGARGGKLAPERRKLLENYQLWLEANKEDTIDADDSNTTSLNDTNTELGVHERVALMEWSVLVQASELERALQLFEAERDVLCARADAKDAEITVLRAELKTQSRVRFQQKTGEVAAGDQEQKYALRMGKQEKQEVRKSGNQETQEQQQQQQHETGPETNSSDVESNSGSSSSSTCRSSGRRSAWEEQLMQAEAHAKARARAERNEKIRKDEQPKQQQLLSTMTMTKVRVKARNTGAVNKNNSDNNTNNTRKGIMTSKAPQPQTMYDRDDTETDRQRIHAATALASSYSTRPMSNNQHEEEVVKGVQAPKPNRESIGKNTSRLVDRRIESGPTDWVALLDPKTQRYYYYSRASKRTVWKLPKGAQATVSTAANVRGGGDKKSGSNIKMSTLEQLQQRVLVEQRLS